MSDTIIWCACFFVGGIVFGLTSFWLIRRILTEKRCETCEHDDLAWDEDPCDNCSGYSEWEARK